MIGLDFFEQKAPRGYSGSVSHCLDVEWLEEG
jgi:hypothetical protein